MIFLDANFLIHGLKAATPHSKALDRWLRDGRTVGISTIAWAEFLCGPVADEDRETASVLLAPPEPLTETDAVLAAELFNTTGRRSRSLADCLIAATCLRLDATLATDNVDDFSRFEAMGLRIASAH